MVSGFDLMVKTVNRFYGARDYLDFGSDFRPPTFFDLVLDFIDISNDQIKDEHRKLQHTHSLISVHGKQPDLEEPELLDFDWHGFYAYLDAMKIRHHYDNHLENVYANHAFRN